jgi:glutamate racemase
MIGVFDSGYGGLTILKALQTELPKYDFMYLGDNARSPYGSRSFSTIYKYTLECVNQLFDMGCTLVILACNTASARALRTIQQVNLPQMADPTKRVLGVLRPVAEQMGTYSTSGHIGILATEGTVRSNSYVLEASRFYPQVVVHQQACPMWVPLVEHNELQGQGASYFVHKYLQQILQAGPQIDALVLGCTHYPLLMEQIQKHVPPHVRIVEQGPIVARSLVQYLQRHPEIDCRLKKEGSTRFYTTEQLDSFEAKAGLFYGKSIKGVQLQQL